MRPTYEVSFQRKDNKVLCTEICANREEAIEEFDVLSKDKGIDYLWIAVRKLTGKGKVEILRYNERR